MTKCNICEKKMPERVLEAHTEKRHFNTELQAKIEANEKEIKELNLAPFELEQFEKTIKPVFDWGPVYACGACGIEFPAKAMPFHAKVVHGV